MKVQNLFRNQYIFIRLSEFEFDSRDISDFSIFNFFTFYYFSFYFTLKEENEKPVDPSDAIPSTIIVYSDDSSEVKKSISVFPFFPVRKSGFQYSIPDCRKMELSKSMTLRLPFFVIKLTIPSKIIINLHPHNYFIYCIQLPAVKIKCHRFKINQRSLSIQILQPK